MNNRKSYLENVPVLIQKKAFIDAGVVHEACKALENCIGFIDVNFISIMRLLDHEAQTV